MEIIDQTIERVKSRIKARLMYQYSERNMGAMDAYKQELDDLENIRKAVMNNVSVGNVDNTEKAIQAWQQIRELAESSVSEHKHMQDYGGDLSEK